MSAATCYAKDSLCFNKEYNALVSYPVLFGGHAAYIAIVLALRQFMKGRPAYSLKGPMLVYNALQVGLSVLMSVQLAPFLRFGFFNLDGQFNAHIEKWILVHFLTKFLDMFDSYFMVLRKKEEQLSFLHVYHHLTIGLIWGLLLHFGIANGTAFFGAWINSTVHAIMYFHYLYTSLGYNNPFKKYITQVQMIQFALCILQAVLAIAVDRQIPALWAWLQFAYHISLLTLFMQFYRKGAKGAARKAKAKAAAAAKQ